MQPIIYLDNSATTAALPEVATAVSDILINNFGNPSSVHGLGIKAEQVLRRSRQNIAQLLQVPEASIYFTSGGTEANNWAIKGLARARRKRGSHIITSGIEHASVLESCRQLEQEGFTVTYLPVSEAGIIDLQALEAALTPDTILVSIMSVNNEIGSVQPLAEISALLQAKNSQAMFHVDHVQGFTKLPLAIEELRLDAVSVSSHKIHGPKGCGALYLKKRQSIQPLISGGDQERSLRGGTENMAGIAGFGVAAVIAARDSQAHIEHLYDLKQQLEGELLAAVPQAVLNSPVGRSGAPQIVNISVPGVRAEVLVHMLEQHGVYVSTGSACHAQRNSDSHVLKALGISPKLVKSAVRLSLCPYNTAEEISLAAAAFKACTREFRSLYN